MTARPRLLVVDDEPHQREMLARILDRAGYDVATAADGREALDALQASEDGAVDLVLTDQRMPGMDGLALLDEVRTRFPGLPVVLMTAYGSVSSAVQAMKVGAADYLTKPFEKDELVLVLRKVLRQRELEDEVVTLRGALRDRFRLGGIVGRAPAMQELFALIERIGPTDVPVLIQGESGTGKELVARALHQSGNRADGPFVATNCAAVPDTLLESEFFGHERGAFTGAVRTRPGLFEQADGGTLFLDEIGAMRTDLQAKLLRVLQDRTVQRLGSETSRKVDVRIVAATCEDLEQALRRRSFREDLYYRLNVVPVMLPPLRDRSEDIPVLVDHFLGRAVERFSRSRVRLSSDALERLQRHPWPGNVRELENCIERVVLLAAGDTIDVDDLPPVIRDGSRPSTPVDGGFRLPPEGVDLQELEVELIRQALRRTRGTLAPAARLLGISYKTLQYRIRKHGLEREAFHDDGPAARDAAAPARDPS